MKSEDSNKVRGTEEGGNTSNKGREIEEEGYNGNKARGIVEWGNNNNKGREITAETCPARRSPPGVATPVPLHGGCRTLRPRPFTRGMSGAPPMGGTRVKMPVCGGGRWTPWRAPTPSGVTPAPFPGGCRMHRPRHFDAGDVWQVDETAARREVTLLTTEKEKYRKNKISATPVPLKRGCRTLAAHQSLSPGDFGSRNAALRLYSVPAVCVSSRRESVAVKGPQA